MTTDSNELQEPRNVEELVNNNVPYSEMSDEEIALVVEYRAQIVARDTAYQSMIDAQRAAAQELINQSAAAYEHARATFDMLVSRALGTDAQ